MNRLLEEPPKAFQKLLQYNPSYFPPQMSSVELFLGLLFTTVMSSFGQCDGCRRRSSAHCVLFVPLVVPHCYSREPITLIFPPLIHISDMIPFYINFSKHQIKIGILCSLHSVFVTSNNVNNTVLLPSLCARYLIEVLKRMGLLD